ncbi:TetR/AcrR family transcriptional regulator [Streptomyces specialis]|uniref:TetR/AcrR family transcriptional regulator n=1 Tax=Streptomyces specialis TaxID=498367 RepID=UPI00073F88F3|nr:TetR/AcrR family transcriptional regulator [Streptomyces specialis]
MTNTEGPSRLAGAYAPGLPGLPRGRSSLPGDVVRKEQRERLTRGVIAAVAEKGYARTTVADVVGRARVSRKVFYEHFADLPACFLAATAGAIQPVATSLYEAARRHRVAREADGRPRDHVEALRSGVRTYLELCAREPEFTRCLVIELPAAGPEALRLDGENLRQFAGLLRVWHERAVVDHPGWAPVTDDICFAAIGAVAALVRVRVVADDTAGLPALEDTVLDVLLRLLAAPR